MILFLETKVLTPPAKTAQEVQFLQKRRLQEGTVHMRCRSPIIVLKFSPWRKSPLSKQCLHQDHCQAQPIKAIDQTPRRLLGTDD